MSKLLFQNLPAEMGTYFLLNTANDRIYVGESENVRVRMRTHRALLIRGIHHNKALQVDWSKYGESAFESGLLADKIRALSFGETFETFFIRLYQSDNPKFGYNLTHFNHRRRSDSDLHHIRALAEHWGISHRRHIDDVMHRCIDYTYQQLIEGTQP